MAAFDFLYSWCSSLTSVNSYYKSYGLQSWHYVLILGGQIIRCRNSFTSRIICGMKEICHRILALKCNLCLFFKIKATLATWLVDPVVLGTLLWYPDWYWGKKCSHRFHQRCLSRNEKDLRNGIRESFPPSFALVPEWWLIATGLLVGKQLAVPGNIMQTERQRIQKQGEGIDENWSQHNLMEDFHFKKREGKRARRKAIFNLCYKWGKTAR